MLNFALFTVYSKESHLPLNVALAGLGIVKKFPLPPPKLFLFPVSQILLLHTD